MRVLYVYCHPLPESFHAAVRKEALAGLEAAGLCVVEGALCGSARGRPIHSATARKTKALTATIPVNARPKPFQHPCL